MAQFNINNSTVEQINDKGTNIKVVGDSGTSKAKERLFIDEIGSFSMVQNVAPAIVLPLLKNGYIDIAEDMVQRAIEEILAVPMHKKDWGGEMNDLYTANVLVDGVRRSTAFLLKGHGLKSNVMEIAHCGANGDQAVRLFRSPADLFVIQFVGNISEAVIQHAHGEIARLTMQGREAYFMTIDGHDTARLLYAYGKLALTPSLPALTSST